MTLGARTDPGVESDLQQALDRGKQEQDFKVWSIPGLIILSLLRGGRGMKAALLLDGAQPTP